MSKIYTKMGDLGETGLQGNIRVVKDDVRIEANGEIDELNSLLGVVRSLMPNDYIHQDLLARIQKELMTIMSVVSAVEMANKDMGGCTTELIGEMEKEIDLLMDNRNFQFVLPGGSQLAAMTHFARAKARTAERRLWTVNRNFALPGSLMCFMNRLSDYLFALAVME